MTSSPAGINGDLQPFATCHPQPTLPRRRLAERFATGGSTFTGWSGGGCSGTGTCQVTLNSDTTVTATFTDPNAPQPTLTVSKSGTGTGTVTSSPAGINCGSTCSAQFASGHRR